MMENQAPERPSVQGVLDAAEELFAPAILDRNDESFIVQKLMSPAQANDESREKLLKKAGGLLQSLHRAVLFESASRTNTQSYDSSLLLALYKLLDFIVLEGIYSSLPTGIGNVAEARNKSLFYAKPDSPYVPLHGSNQLELIFVSILDPILRDVDSGIEPLLRHRILSSIIAGNAILGHDEGRATFTSAFAVYLERLPTSTLFACYTTLLRTAKVDWFRSVISESLSLLPLRMNGVRSTIDFLAASHQQPQAKANDENSVPSSGPAIPLEALQQASKLLSSVPRSMSQDDYLSNVGPQLLSLLDSQNEPALQKAASFIIGNGILGKRNLGSPGSIGWTLLAVPILGSISPSGNSTSVKRKASSLNKEIEMPLVAQTDLDIALRRLSLLVLSYPNPGITGRLVRPLLLPLWALSAYQGISFTATEMSKRAFAILAQFLKLVGTPANLIALSDNLLCQGTGSWIFAPSGDGGIAIRRLAHQDLSLRDEEHLVEQVARIDNCVASFSRLMRLSQISDEAISTLFFHNFSQQTDAPKTKMLGQGTGQELLKSLLRAKLLQVLIESFADRLVKNSDQVLMLVSRILEQYGYSKRNERGATNEPLSLSSLGSITRSATADEDVKDATDYQDSLLLVLSLLNALLASMESPTRSHWTSKLATIRQHLTMIESLEQRNEALILQLKTSLALLDRQLSPTNTLSVPDVDTESALDVQRTLSLITADITSDLPPIRRSALHALQALIKSPDAPMDVPPVALLLLDVLRADPEEYVYLAAVKTTVQLAVRRNPGYVIRLLVDTFQDVEEQTGIDGRLRVGETLSSIAEELSDSNARDLQIHGVIDATIHSLLAVASRRGQRQREQLARQREERLQRRKRKEAERAWGGDVPDEPIEEDENLEVEVLSPAEKQRRLRDLEQIESIVKGWEDTGHEEDVRIRASTLSITGRLLEHSTPNASTTTNTIELCLSILSVELDLAKAILRRAAALAIFGILKRIDMQLEGSSGGREGIVRGEDWLKVEKVLRWVVDTDPDDLTVGHSETVLEGLEAVRMKLLAGAVQSATHQEGLDGQLKGLSVAPQAATSHDSQRAATARRPIIEELE